MRIKAYVSIVDYAETIGEVTPKMDPVKRRWALQRLRRRCLEPLPDLDGLPLAERVPGLDRALRVPTDRVMKVDPDAYQRMLKNSRFWEDGCPHPVKRVVALSGGMRWCEGCGSMKTTPTGPWRLPLSQQLEYA